MTYKIEDFSRKMAQKYRTGLKYSYLADTFLLRLLLYAVSHQDIGNHVSSTKQHNLTEKAVSLMEKR